MLGAAWSAPVVALAVGAPLAAASPGPVTAQLAWLSPPGVQKESSLLLLTLQPASAGSPVIRGTGTLTLTVLESFAFAPAKEVLTPAGWTVINDFGRTITVLAPEGTTAGSKGFNVSWGELSGNWTVVATWTESDASGSVTATIEVGPRGFPALDWTTNPATFGGSSTLRLRVPADCYAIGYPALVAVGQELPADSVMTLPAGWTVSDLTLQGGKVFEGPSVVAGSFDFDFTFGQGSAPLSISPTWISPQAPGTTPIFPHEPLQLTAD
ncbi:hypothetical protein C5B96_05915 [Subtercola sp. Z020]|nr:hypothetical protein C5B96_05915 [Subtercola sp. Z020]